MSQLPKGQQQRLAKELRFAADKMREEGDVFRKIYFFSAMHGEIGRLLNWTWNRQLVLVHSVLQTTHRQFSTVTQGVASRQEKAIRLPDEMFEKLIQVADDLATYFEAQQGDEDLLEILERFAELAYATTGNGNYLVERGILKL